MNVIPHPSWLKLIFIDGGRFVLWDGPRALWRGAKRHPKLWVLFLALVGLGVLFGRAAAYVVYAPALLVPWWLLDRASFRRWVVGPLRSDWRRHMRYQRRWPDVMSLNRLSIPIDNALDVHPEIVKARTTDWSRSWHWHWQWRWPLLSTTVACTDTLWVRTLISDDLEDYQERVPTIARDFAARTGRAFDETGRPKGTVRLELTYGPDPLARIVPPIAVPERAEDVDLTAIPVGVKEDGTPWTLAALGSQTLVAGITGSGKSSLTWSFLRGLGPAIKEGRVIVWAIDPKGGMSLGPGRPLFDRYCSGTVPEMVAMLEDAVRYMDARTKSLEEVATMHVPTVAQPFLLVVVDEFARISKFKGDKTSANAANAAIEALVNVGRAAGVGVWVCTQSPLKEVIAQRDEFPNRVGFRMVPRIYNNEVLGADAWSRGARCSEIPASMPGVAWIREEDGELTRVRAAYVPRDEVVAMAAKYGRGPMLADEPDLPPAPPFDVDATADEEIPVLELVQGDG